MNVSAYVPDIPNELPLTHVYRDGDGGLSNDWRIREHWIPSPAWADLMATGPPVRSSRCLTWCPLIAPERRHIPTQFSMELPNIKYPPELVSC